MFKNISSKTAVLLRLLSRLSPKRIGKAFYVLFTEGPKAMLKKSLEANYIDSDFEAFKNAANSGLFLFYRPELEGEAKKLISEFLNFGLELKISDKKDENGVSILLFPDGSEKPEGSFVIIASGDMSHMLCEDGPYGYSEPGMYFEGIMDSIFESGDLSKISDISMKCLNEAGQCGLGSLRLAVNSVPEEHRNGEKYSHEWSFGIGYMVASLMTRE